MATNSSTLAQFQPADVQIFEAGQVRLEKMTNALDQYGIPALRFQGQAVGQKNITSALFVGVLPQGTGGYSATTGVKVQIVSNSATAGVAVWAASFDLIGATDLPNPITELWPAFGGTNEVTGNATYTAAGLAIYTTISVPLAKIQNGQTTAPAAGDLFRLRLRRATDNASDTLADFANVFFVSLQDY